MKREYWPWTIIWIGRVIAIGIVALILTIFAAERFPNPFHQPLPVAIELSLLLLLIAGLLTGLARPLVGAVVVAVSLAGFNIVELAANHRLPGGAFPFFWVPVVLYVFAYGAVRLLKRPNH